MLSVQNLLRNERGNLGCEPYVQTQSRQVNTTFPFFSLLSTAPRSQESTISREKGYVSVIIFHVGITTNVHCDFLWCLLGLTFLVQWPEVNQRIVYPIKDVLVRMENALMINLSEPAVQFCVSFVTMNNVAEIGLKRVVASWNWHSIEGKKRS